MRTLKIGDVTITSIIERDGPWRQPEDMFPAYDPDLGRRYLADMDPEVYRRRLQPHGDHLPDLRRAHAASHDPGRYLHRRGQGLSRADGFPQAALARRVQSRGPEVRRYRLRLLHPSAHRPLRLEHRAARRSLGADVPEARNTSSTSGNTQRGRKPPSAATSRPATSGDSTASRSSRPARRCWSMTTTRWTIR